MRDHDAHGPRSGRMAGRGPATSCRACTRSARRSTPAQKDVRLAVQRHGEVDRSFPETREIWSFGSGYGGNALLGKKCLALRIASVMARDEGWLAEHMLILGIQPPAGKKTLHRCGVSLGVRQDQPRHADSARGVCKGWKVTTIGEDIAWIKPGRTGASTPSIPKPASSAWRPARPSRPIRTAMADAAREHDLHQRRHDARWRRLVGRHDRRSRRRSSSTGRASHGRPRQRPARRASQRALHRACGADPVDGSEVGGSRRACRSPHSSSAAAARRTVPLVVEAPNWEDGVYMAATMGSETTAAITGKVGVVRRDPMAMLAVLRLQHGGLLRALAEDRAAQLQAAAADFPRQLVPPRRRTANSSGRASARTCACCSGSSSAAKDGAARHRNAARHACRASKT